MASDQINQYIQHTLREDFTSPNPEVRKGAIYALGRLGSGGDVLVILRNVAAMDDDPEVRYTAKKALNYWEGVLTEDPDDGGAVEVADADGALDPAALRAGLGSTRSGRQIAAIVEAVKLGDPTALPLIREIMGEDQDPWVLSMAIKAHGALGDRDAVARVAPFLEHANHRVVANAIEALEMLGDPEVAPRLRPFLDSDDNRVRANAVKALHPHDPDAAIATLEVMAVNHRPWMRASAIFCLKVLDDPRCQQILLEMLRKEYADELMRQLLDAVVAQGDREAVGVLATLADGADERAGQAKTALRVLAEKLELDPTQVDALKRDAAARAADEEGLRSGVYRLEAIRDDDPPAPPPAPRRRGYGEAPEAGPPPREDPGSLVAIGVALGLGTLAALYGAAKLFGA